VLDALPWTAVGELLRRQHRLLAQINVYSDGIGGPIGNHALTELRALALLTALHTAAIRSIRVTGTGMGAADELANDDTPEGRERNRRVEVVFGLAASGGGGQ